jgi:hypothetical protein
MQQVTVGLPARWAPAGSGKGRVGPHEARWEAGRLFITPAEATAHLEQVLADLFLERLGDRTPPWLMDFEQARRAAARAEDFIAVSGPTTEAANSTDRYLFSADLAHRLLFERRWSTERPGTCVWIMVNPGTRDLLQGVDGKRLRDTPSRSNLGVAVNRTRQWALMPPNELADWRAIGSVTILNLFTSRSANVATAGRQLPTQGAVKAPATANHVKADQVISQATGAAVATIGAWGWSGPKKLGKHRPEEVRRAAADAGATLFGVYGTRAGRRVRWLTHGQPRYTLGLPADAVPAPLDQLLADTGTPLP